MSRNGKIVIAIVVVVLIVGIVGAGWFIARRGWPPRALAQRPAAAREVEVRLIDDNGDGIPDRGVIDRPARGAFSPDFGPGQGEPGRPDFARGRGRLVGLLFAPFFLIGGLIRGLISLAVLALLVSPTVFFYRRWQPALPVGPVSSPPAPVEAQSTALDTQEEVG